MAEAQSGLLSTILEQGAAAATSDYLGNGSKYLVRVSEVFTEGDVLLRDVDVDIQLPEFAKDKFLFPVCTPRKGKKFNVAASLNGSKEALRQLSHDEHIALSRDLIRFDFTLLLLSARIPRGTVLSSIDIESALTKMLRLPELPDPTQALELYAELFMVSGKPKFLERFAVDFDAALRLKNLCELLSSRWLTVIIVPRPETEGPVKLTYSYERIWKDNFPTFASRIRSVLKGAPYEYKIHIPLARLCRHYSCSMQAQTGRYFSNVRPVRDAEAVHNTDGMPHRLWRQKSTLEPNVRDIDASISLVHREDVTKASVDFFDGGRLTSRAYLYLKSLEKPPGSTIPAAIFILVSSCILAWNLGFIAFGTGTVNGITSVLIAASIPFLSFLQSQTPFKVNKPAVMPNVLAVAQIVLCLVFLAWIQTSPNRPPIDTNTKQYILHLLSALSPGIAILAISITSSGYLVRRSIRIVKAYFIGKRETAID